MNFSIPQTAEQFEAVPGFEQDRQVSLVGKFSKLVSNLSPEEAQVLIDNGVNYIRQKSVPPAAPQIVVEKEAETPVVTPPVAEEIITGKGGSKNK